MYRCDYCDGFAVISATVSLRPSSFKDNFNDTVTLITTIHFMPEHVPAWNVSLWLLWRYRWGQVYLNTIPTIPSHWSQRTRHNSQNDTFHAGTEFPTRAILYQGICNHQVDICLRSKGLLHSAQNSPKYDKNMAASQSWLKFDARIIIFFTFL